MTVIFGIKEENQIIIAGDKRLTTIDGKFISDNGEKISVINNHLALCSAGSLAISNAIGIEINKVNNIDAITTDDLLNTIETLCNRITSSGSKSLPSSFSCIIAGKGQNNSLSLISAGIFKGHFSSAEVPMVLYPPTNNIHNECNLCFARNYNLYHDKFPERTIHEISQISNLVSPTGEKWIYDIRKQKGTLYSF